MLYNEMNLSKELKQTLEEIGYENATPIQEAMIPVAIEGHDVIGQAQTGTGKTAAFLIPAIEKMTSQSHLQTLVLVPTRELALQVHQVFRQLTKNHHFKSITVFGGVSITDQMKQLGQGVQCVIATPGRLLDIMNRKKINLNKINFLVLDEVDEMLNMGFLEDVEKIMNACNLERQTFFLSATMNKSIIELSHSFMNNPTEIHIESKSVTGERIKQYYVKVNEDQKLKALLSLFYTQKIHRAMIFVRTKRKADELSQELTKHGIKADCIHGDLSQSQRTIAFNKFRSHQTKLLIATDVAARGLDIDDISHVFNYDLPDDFEYYVHRIGRTGRIGNSGTAITFFSPRQVLTVLGKYERLTKVKFELMILPSADDITVAIIGQSSEAIIEALQNPINDYVYNQAKALIEMDHPTRILAAALSLLTPKVNVSSIVVQAPKHDRNKSRNRNSGGQRSDQRNRNSSGQRNDQRDRNAGGRSDQRDRDGKYQGSSKKKNKRDYSKDHR